jgi:hypothetical protein
MTQANSPAYRQGQEHKQAHNDALASCPPFWTEPDPSAWGGYTVMYDRGWLSIPEGIAHSCERCNPEHHRQDEMI